MFSGIGVAISKCWSKGGELIRRIEDAAQLYTSSNWRDTPYSILGRGGLMEKGGTLRHDVLTAIPGGPVSFSYLYIGDSVCQMCYEVRCADVSMRRSAGDFHYSCRSPILGIGWKCSPFLPRLVGAKPRDMLLSHVATWLRSTAS